MLNLIPPTTDIMAIVNLAMINVKVTVVKVKE